tara:strand:- start:4971 stop:5267 length:297 start_codon:yes stop_codon:yes gene_type:complete
MNDSTQAPTPGEEQIPIPETDPATMTEAGDSSEVAESNRAAEFANAAEGPEMGFFAEFWDFLVHNKAWWLTPIILVLLLVFALVLLAGTPFAPFIYGA